MRRLADPAFKSNRQSSLDRRIELLSLENAVAAELVVGLAASGGAAMSVDGTMAESGPSNPPAKAVAKGGLMV